MIIDALKFQHTQLLEMAEQLDQLLVIEKIQSDPVSVIRLLGKFSAKLRVHLSLEDEVFYPLMLKAKQKELRKIAKKFQEEMGPVSIAVGNYLEYWSLPIHLINETDVFISQSKELIQTLANRIDKEDNELYPLFHSVKEQLYEYFTMV